jgi:hypothetical protein
MKSINVKYRLYSDKTSQFRQFGKFPFLWVRLAHEDKYIELDCLVDSGAGDSLFTVDVAEALEIDLNGAPEKSYFGLDNKEVIARVYPLQLQVKGFDEWITIEAGFIEIDQIPLLGQSGFFDNYEVTFRRYKGRFEVSSRTFLRASTGNKYLM